MRSREVQAAPGIERPTRKDGPLENAGPVRAGPHDDDVARPSAYLLNRLDHLKDSRDLHRILHVGYGLNPLLRRYRRQTMIRYGLVALALLVAPTGATAQCENAESFMVQLQDIGRETGFRMFTGRWRCNSGTFRVQVNNSWFAYQCHERRQLLTSFNTLWKAEGGVRVIVTDVTDADVATVGILGGLDIEGCERPT